MEKKKKKEIPKVSFTKKCPNCGNPMSVMNKVCSKKCLKESEEKKDV